MFNPLAIRLFQFNWFWNLCMVPVSGVMGGWLDVIRYSIGALLWALLLQKFTDGEDLLAKTLLKKWHKETQNG